MGPKFAHITAFVFYLMVCTANPPQSLAKAPACDATPIRLGNGFPEVQGNSDKAEMWGLIFQRPPLHAEREVKIVWRMTIVEGLVKVVAQDEGGTTVLPIWGPEEHGGSNWAHPGREWGTGFIFPHAGCWTIKILGEGVSGEVKFDVMSPFMWF